MFVKHLDELCCGRVFAQGLAPCQSPGRCPRVRQQGRVCENGADAAGTEMGPSEHARGRGGGELASQIPGSASQ